MPLSRQAHRDALDNEFSTTRHIGLSSTTPTSTGGNVTEPSGGGYARVAVAAADWDAATDADPALVDNASDIAFPQATADWVSGGDLTHAVMYDAASGGSFRGFAPLDQAKPVLNGDTLTIAAGDLDFEMGDADTDTFTGT